MPSTLSNSIQHYRKQLQSFAVPELTLYKSAELGGGTDVSFEQAFANLAHAYLKDKAPSLLDYEVGFQLIDRDQDNTKAVGIFGFKVGSQWLYAPVFFLNGDLKGHELLYIKNQDMFVPMKENWLNYLLNRKPNVLGEGVTRNTRELGVLSPHFYQLSRSPSKYASVKEAGKLTGALLGTGIGALGGGALAALGGTRGDIYKGKDSAWLEDVFGKSLQGAGAGGIAGAGLGTVVGASQEADEKKRQEEQLKIEYLKTLIANNKVASWALPVLPDLAYFATTSPLHDEKYANLHNLLDFVKDAGSSAIMCLIKTIDEHPALATHLNNIYGKANLDNAVKEAASLERERKSVLNTSTKIIKAANANKRPLLSKQLGSPEENISGVRHNKLAASKKIKVIKSETIKVKTGDPGWGMSISDGERDVLIRGKSVIRDKRDDKEVNIAYNLEVPLKLESASSSGLYDVLVKPFEFKKCLVIIGPYDCRGRKIWCTVVDVQTKAWVNTHSYNVLTRSQYSDSEYDDWFKELPEGSLGRGSLKMIVGPTAQASVPITSDSENGGHLSSYDVVFHGHTLHERPGSLIRPKKENDPLHNIHASRDRVVFTDKPGKSLKAMGSELLVPNTYKVLSLDEPMCGCGVDSEPPPILDLGTMADFHLGVIKSGMQKLAIKANSTYATINSKELPLEDAVISLVVDYNLREKQARDIIDLAKSNHINEFLVKSSAAEYDLQRSAPSAPTMPEPEIGMDPLMGGKVPTQMSQDLQMEVPGMSAQHTDRSVYDVRPDAYSQPNMVGGSNDGGSGIDKKTLGVAQNAAETGQKEVFDTAMIGSLLKVVRDDSMVDKYLGDIMKGMDRLGRILFLFYWHQDKFEDRYGKEDLPELEDSLRNGFEAVGDIAQFLKAKTIDTYPDEPGQSDLADVADR